MEHSEFTSDRLDHALGKRLLLATLEFIDAAHLLRAWRTNRRGGFRIETQWRIRNHSRELFSAEIADQQTH